MAKYRITAPDGQKYDITAPDDATEDQVMSYAQQNYKQPKSDPVMAQINRSHTAGLLDAAGSLVSGAIAAPVSGIAGLAQGAKNLVSPGMEAGDRVRQVQDALTYEPRTDIGKGLTHAVSYPFEKLADLGNYAGEKTTEKTGSPALGAVANTTLQAIPLMLGRVAPIGESASTLAKRNALREANRSTDLAITNAKEAGYKLPPTQANPSVWNQIVEGFAGKIKTGQKLSEQNQLVTNDLVREGLGLPKDATLNAETLNQVRKNAADAYERVRGAGRITADKTYLADLDSIAAPFERAAKDFPEAARTDILDAVKSAKKESFDSSSAVDQIRSFRAKADKEYAGKDKELGRAYKSIANALEEQLGRHLEQSGAPAEALADFRNARETIAKSYTVEKHLQPNGNVDAKGLGNELKRKPLSGEIKTAAEFGKNFPKAAQLPEKVGGSPMSPLDHGFSLASLAGAFATGQPLVALAGLAPYARMGARNAIVSDAYQNRFVNPRTYEQSPLTSMQQMLLESQGQPLIPLSEISQGQRQ